MSPQLNLLRTAQPIAIAASLTLRHDGRWSVGFHCLDHRHIITASADQTAQRGTDLQQAPEVVHALIQHWINSDEESLAAVLNEELRVAHRIAMNNP